MVDCGFGLKETELRLNRMGLQAEQISAVVVTHEHGDHIKGVGPLSRKYKMPVYMTEGTYMCRDHGKIPSLRLISHYEPFKIDDVTVIPVPVPHDAKEPAQFIFEVDGKKLGVLTDLGSISSIVNNHFHNCTALLVEANHDLDMLANGPYPISLKKRVASNWGHLNNNQTAAFLEAMNLDSLNQLVIGHISLKNNSIERVREALASIESQFPHIHYASQDDGFDWLVVD